MRELETIHIANINGKELVLRETDTYFKTPYTELQGADYTTTRFTFPKRAHVYLTEDNGNIFGEKSHRIVIWPPGNYEVYNFGQAPIRTQITGLLGERYTIDENGSFSTALLDALQFAEEKLGYSIHPQILEALGLDDSKIESIFGEMLD